MIQPLVPKLLTDIFQESSQSSRSSSRREPSPAKCSTSSLQPKFKQNRNHNQNRRPSGQNVPHAPQNTLNKRLPTKTEESTREESIIESSTVQEDDLYEPEPDRFGEDDRVPKKELSRASRSRSDPYKTRGSVVKNLHHDEGRGLKRKAHQDSQARKPKLHLPRIKDKPRMDVYIPTTVTVGTLARILNVKFGTLFLPSYRRYSF